MDPSFALRQSIAVATMLLMLPQESVFSAEAGQVRPWPDYRVIMWIGGTVTKKPEKWPLFLQRMREMGVNTGMVSQEEDPAIFVDNHFPFYVENIVNRGLCLKFSSKVTDWNKFVTAWGKDRDDAALVRDYSLDDPKWRDFATKQMQKVAKQDRAKEPIAYDIRDELSTTISANPFDYDFSPATLASFRGWLRKEYNDLEALNREWGTGFKEWESVLPFTTDQVKNRMVSGDAIPRGKPDWQALRAMKYEPDAARKKPSHWNLAPWCDFRTYMDTSLATALADIRAASHEVDPRTPVGIEGTQMPSAFGGYDLWKLSQSLDWVEAYDIGNSREIFGSFMPGKTILTTVGEKDALAAKRRLWHLLLEGDKGCLVWWSEDSIDFQSDDYALTPRAKALIPALKDMTGSLAALFMHAEREFDPIAIHYSQSSIQVDWLLESIADGSTWLRRFSSFESANNRLIKVRDGWLKALTDLGYSPQFISSEQVENGGLSKGGFVACVLPNTLAITDREMPHLEGFPKSPQHVLFCDGNPGAFDGHGKLRGEDHPFKVLPGVLSQDQAFCLGTSGSRGMSDLRGDIASYPGDRLSRQSTFLFPKWMAENLRNVPLTVSVPLESRTAIFRYRLGNARLLAFERNVDYQMSEELQQAGGNESLQEGIDVTATLKTAGHIYDLRSGKYLGKSDSIHLHLDPWEPSLFALLPEKVADGDIIGALSKLTVQRR